MKISTTCLAVGCILATFLAACELKGVPIPTKTPIQPTHLPSLTPTPIPSATPTIIPTYTRKPSSSPQPTEPILPINTLAVSPTPVPGWVTYTNGYLGYSLNYPVGAKIYTHGAGGMDTNEVVPAGFTFDEYFDYVMAVLPEELCVSVALPGAMITLSPPYDPIGSYVGPCPGMGIGDQYNIEQADDTWWIAGKQYSDWMGMKLYLKDGGAFYSEIYIFYLQNGFRVVYNGMPHGEMSEAAYHAQRSAVMEMLTTLHWWKVPDLTKPGTTCAGKYTHLFPGMQAIVSGATSDPPNRVREEPSLSAEVISQVYPGTILEVLEGPVCANEMVFWKVAQPLIPGWTGWTAEGSGAEYWLTPYHP